MAGRGARGVERLERAFGFDDSAQAVAFTDRVGEQAEEEGHIDVLAIMATLFGVAVSLGTLQIDAGLNQTFGMPAGTSHITTRP